jgi:hypothetical protein
VNEEASRSVTVRRVNGSWIIRVPEVAEVVIRPRPLADVRRQARDAVAGWLTRRADDLELDVSRIDPVVRSLLTEARRLRREADVGLQRVGSATSAALRRLTEELGSSLREPDGSPSSDRGPDQER